MPKNPSRNETVQTPWLLDAREVHEELLNRHENLSDDLTEYVNEAATRIAEYLEKTLDGIVAEGAYCNEKAKRRIHDILTEELYVPVVMHNK